MKTTIELPDGLMQRAKRTALERRMTLKQLFTEALRKEIDSGRNQMMGPLMEVAEDGLPYLRKRGEIVRSELIDQLDEASGG